MKFSMALVGKRKHYVMDRVEARHFLSTARALGMSEQEARRIVERLALAAPAAVDAAASALPQGFSMRAAEAIFAGVQASASALLEGWARS